MSRAGKKAPRRLLPKDVPAEHSEPSIALFFRLLGNHEQNIAAGSEDLLWAGIVGMAVSPREQRDSKLLSWTAPLWFEYPGGNERDAHSLRARHVHDRPLLGTLAGPLTVCWPDVQRS